MTIILAIIAAVGALGLLELVLTRKPDPEE